MTTGKMRSHCHPCWPQLPALLPVCCIVGAKGSTVNEEKSLEGFSLKSKTTELSTPTSGI